MKFKIPSSITPRPGERVIVYQDLSRHEGVFKGYNSSDGLIIHVTEESFITVHDFLQLRPKDPFLRTEPCWKHFLTKSNFSKATKKQKQQIDEILNQVIAPGPSYLEFINEIWSRGYETFLVGGGVRDVLNGEKPKDVDLVTTIPFNILEPLVKSMFGENGCSRSEKNGFISVGKDAKNFKNRNIFDPLIDVKNIFSYSPGTKNAQFGANIEHDYKFRDFACNSVYYEPINSFFIDPSGIGLEDAKYKRLSLVNDTPGDHPKYKKADISFRFFKFIRRGFTPTETCITEINAKIKPLMGALGHVMRVNIFKKYFLNDIPKSQRSQVLSEVRDIMIEYRYEDVWDRFFSNHTNELIDNE